MKTFDTYDIMAALDAMGFFMCFLCLVCTAVIYQGNVSNRKRFFYYVQAFVITGAVLAADTLTCLTRGETTLIAKIVYRCGYIITYIGTAILAGNFIFYLLREIKSRAVPVLLRIVRIFLAAFVLIVGITQFTGWYYYIDAQNCFHRGPMFWAASAIFAAIAFLFGILVIIYRRRVSTWKFVMMLLMALIPASAMVFQMFFKFSFLYLSYLFSTICLFFCMQRDVTDRLIADEKVQKEQELRLLNTQLNPHVLYNALASIQGIPENPQQTIDSISVFGRYLRAHITAITHGEMIPFEEEMKSIEQFGKLQRLRFGDRLKINFELETTGFSVPRLTVLTIVENIIGKNFTPGKEGNAVMISSTSGPRNFYVSVSDREIRQKRKTIADCIDEKDEEVMLSLDNVEKNIQYRCGGRLEVETSPDRCTVITLVIPKKYERQ